MQRCRADGFRTGRDKDADLTTWNEIWQPNKLDSRQRIVYSQMLVHGRGLMSVWPNAANKRSPIIRVESSKRVHLEPDPEDPTRYLQPDVVADFSSVRLTEMGADRVAVEGATGQARPTHLKATLGYREGYIGEGQISYAGPGARARGQLALDILEARLKRLGLHALEHRAELIGVNAMHGPTLGADREPYEVRVRLALRAPTRAQAELVGQEVEALYLNGPGGGGGVTQTVREVVAAASALIPREAVPTDCRILEL